MRETGKRGDAELRQVSIFNSSKRRNEPRICQLKLADVLKSIESVYTATNHQFSSNRP